jgi:hypothetical protein
LPEIGLGIGRERGTYQGITREWLYWFDEQGKRFFTPEERIQESEERRLQAERQLLESEEKSRKLAEMLKNLGVDPESLN